jgi:hypothetical protein
MEPKLTWKERVGDIVGNLPKEFSLEDVLRFKSDLQRQFPNNRFVDAKIRQSLQILRDRGMLRFLGNGRYERLDVGQAFSPLFDTRAAEKFISAAQAARETLETWASFNLYCLACEKDALDRLRANAPVADFECYSCGATYQLKAKNGRFGARLTGAAFEPTVTGYLNPRRGIVFRWSQLVSA